MTVMLEAVGVSKTFTLHLQGGVQIQVLMNHDFKVAAGECVALTGSSGAGKTTLMRVLYGTYRIDAGAVRARHQGCMVTLSGADPRIVLDVRARTLGYVSQFLHVVPRVPALDIVAGTPSGRDRARALLTRLGIPDRLHGVPPAVFSGGERQRVNLARGFMGQHPVLLLDEPTASLDTARRDVVIAMINEAKAAGAAVVGIFHDRAVVSAVADRVHVVAPQQELA